MACLPKTWTKTRQHIAQGSKMMEILFKQNLFWIMDFLWLSNVHFSKFCRKVFAIEFSADYQKMEKKESFFQKNLLEICLWTRRTLNWDNCSSFLAKKWIFFSVDENHWKKYRSQNKLCPETVPLDLINQFWNRVKQCLPRPKYFGLHVRHWGKILNSSS